MMRAADNPTVAPSNAGAWFRPPVPKGRAIDLRGNLHMIYAQDTIPASTKSTVGNVPRLVLQPHLVYSICICWWYICVHSARFTSCVVCSL